MVSFEELRAKMQKSMIDASTKVLTNQGAIIPKTYSDIPKLFVGWDGTASKAVRGALWIAKKYNLIPPDTPLRQVWYMFIKLVYQKLHPSKRVLNPVDSFTKSFADIMKATDFWYKDFNVVNPPSDFKKTDRFWKAELFPNVLLALEKKSYYKSMDIFADLLGLNLYASGGQSSFSNAEDISRTLHEAHSDNDVNIYTISDYDPAGFNIGDALESHFTSYLQRTGQEVKATKVSPYPIDYTPEELKVAQFIVSPETVKHEKWNRPERVKERIDTNLIDHRFEDIDFYDESEGSEIRDVLSEGFLSPKKHVKWIREWREKVKTGQIPHMLGLEVESLPREPLQKHLPDGMTPDEAIGNARMRLLVYNKLLEDFHLKDVIKNFYTKYYIDEYPSQHAWKLFKQKAGILKLEKIKEEIDEKLDEVISRQEDILKDDYEILEEQLEEWINDIDADGELIKKFEESLRRAVALNYDQKGLVEKLDYTEISKEVNDYKLDQDTIDALEEESENNINFFNDVLKKIKEEIDEENEI